MPRKIITSELQAAGTDQKIDTYFDRIVKYIPGDVVGAWVTAKGLVQASSIASKETVLWGCLIVGIGFTAWWTRNQTDKSTTQTVVSTFAFLIWTLALGEPFTSLLGPGAQGLFGSLLLIAFTLFTGRIIPEEGH